MKSKRDTLQKQRRPIAVLLMILSALMFSAMQLMIKLSNTSGSFPLMEQVFFRNLLSVLVAGVFLLRKGVFPLGHKSAQPYLFGRSIAGFLGIITFFYATNHARIADANILNKLSPIVVTILAAVFLRERVAKVQYAALAISFLGAWLVCGSTLQSDSFAMFVALLSAVFSGIAYTFVSVLKQKADPLVVIMHFSTFSVLCATLGMLRSFVMPTAEQFCYLFLISIFGSLGQIALTYSYKFAPASEISIYNYSGIIWSALLGWVFLKESLPSSTIVGGLLVIGASLITFLHNRTNNAHSNLAADASEEVS